MFRTGLVMKPVFDRAKGDVKRVVYAEGEEDTILRAVQNLVDDRMARPILIGRPAIIERRINRLGLRIRAGEHFELCNVDDDPRFSEYWSYYLQLNERRGITPALAKSLVRSRPTLIGALMLARGEADAMICGMVGRYQRQLRHILDVIPLDPGVNTAAAMTAVQNDRGTWFFVDTHVQHDPTAEEIAEATCQAVLRLKLFGITPKVALLSHSNFGSHNDETSKKMRRVLEIVRKKDPALEIDGEMQADSALNEEIRDRIFPNSLLKGAANVFVFPSLDAANIAYNMVRQFTDGIAIGPILMGVSKPVHVLTTAATVGRVVNISARACVEAQIRQQAEQASRAS